MPYPVRPILLFVKSDTQQPAVDGRLQLLLRALSAQTSDRQIYKVHRYVTFGQRFTENGKGAARINAPSGLTF
jgi:hypothetical protein